MKYYELIYIYASNTETGATGSLSIARSYKKEDIEKIIKDNNLEVKTSLRPGESYVFLLKDFEPVFPEFFDETKLNLALEYEEERILETIKKWDYHPYKDDSDVFNDGKYEKSKED